MQMLYNYLTSTEFRQKFEAIVEAFQEMQARRVVAEGLSVRAVEEAVRLREGSRSSGAAKRPAGASTAKEASAKPASLLELESVLADLLATRVGIELSEGRKGRMTIEFADLADLERISRLIATPTAPNGE